MGKHNVKRSNERCGRASRATGDGDDESDSVEIGGIPKRSDDPAVLAYLFRDLAEYLENEAREAVRRGEPRAVIDEFLRTSMNASAAAVEQDALARGVTLVDESAVS